MGNQQTQPEPEESSSLLADQDPDAVHYDATTTAATSTEEEAPIKGDPNGDTEEGDTAEDVSYLQLLSDNPNFRYYWISYVANHMGEWMTYLASISLIQEIELSKADPENSRVSTLISILIVVKLLPNVFFMPLGGVLADLYDRRKVQIALDVTSAFLVLVYLVAVHYRSIVWLYVANFCQECLSGLYIPSNSAMLPMLASKNDAELQKATTLSGLTWSLMAALGSSTGGVLVALFGVQGCFMIDSATYFVSAALLAHGVQGTFVATEEEKKEKRRSSVAIKRNSNPLALQQQLQSLAADEEDGAPTSRTSIHSATNNEDNTSQWDMFCHGLRFAFVETPLVGAYALLKGSAALAYGASDVLNVSFSARGNETDPTKTSLKLGILFGCVGIGCILGSLMCDRLVTLSQPLRIVRLCLFGYSLIAIGLVIMGMFPDLFSLVCVSGTIRSTGSSLLWINSVLLLQKYSPPTLLGRVQSIDFAAALLGEAFSALGGGLLMDDYGVLPEHLSNLLALVALACFVFWSPLVGFKTPPETS